MRVVTIWRPPAEARHTALSPGLVCAAVLTAEGEVSVIDPRTGTSLASLRVPAETRWIAIDDRGALVATVDAGRKLAVVAVARPDQPRAVAAVCGRRHTAAVDNHHCRDDVSVVASDLVFSPDGAELAVSEWNYHDQETYYGGGSLHGDSSTEVVRWATGARAAAAHDSTSGTITYSAQDDNCYPDHPGATEFSADGQRLALVMRKRERVLLRRRGAEGWERCEGPPHDKVRTAAFTADGSALLVARVERVIRWELGEAREGAAFVAGEVVALAHAADSRVACARTDGTVTLVMEGRHVATLPAAHASPATAVRWIGELLAVRCADGALVLYGP